MTVLIEHPTQVVARLRAPPAQPVNGRVRAPCVILLHRLMRQGQPRVRREAVLQLEIQITFVVSGMWLRAHLTAAAEVAEILPGASRDESRGLTDPASSFQPRDL